MTKESERDRASEMLTFFIEKGIESTKLLSLEAIAKFSVTPHQFYGIMISLLESFVKNFSTNADASDFKKIFNDKKRQKLVNVIDRAISTNSTQ